MARKTKTPCLAGCAGVVAVGRSRGEADRRRLSGGSGERVVGEGERRGLVGRHWGRWLGVAEGVIGSDGWGVVVGLGVSVGSVVGTVGTSGSWGGKSCGVVALAWAWARASLSC